MILFHATRTKKSHTKNTIVTERSRDCSSEFVVLKIEERERFHFAKDVPLDGSCQFIPIEPQGANILQKCQGVGNRSDKVVGRQIQFFNNVLVTRNAVPFAHRCIGKPVRGV